MKKKAQLTAPQQLEASEKDVRHTRIFSFLGVGVLVAAVIAIAVVIFWVNQPSDVLEIRNQPVPVRTIRSAAHPEGVVILKYSYCKNYNTEGRVRTSFVSQSSEIFLPVATDRTDKTCLDNIEVPVLVPPQIVSGKYKLHFRATYQINPLKQAIIEWDSQEFEIVK